MDKQYIELLVIFGLILIFLSPFLGNKILRIFIKDEIEIDQYLLYKKNPIFRVYKNTQIHVSKLSSETKKIIKNAYKGDSNAQYNLGGMYAKGLGGLEKNEIEAVKLWKLATEQGNSNAQYSLGEMYAKGLGGLEKNEIEAVKLWKLATEQGNSNAQFNLGMMYAEGLGGLEKNKIEAVKLYKLSAAQGNAYCQCNLGVMYLFGTNSIETNEIEAARLLKLAAEQGNADAQCYLGQMYFLGLGGLEKNEVEAVRLQRLSAEQCILAQYCLGIIYLYSQKIPHQYNLSIEYFLLAIKNKMEPKSEIFLHIGRAYKALKQPEVALSYFRESIKISNMAEAFYEAAWIYVEMGDTPKAIACLDNALSYLPAKILRGMFNAHPELSTEEKLLKLISELASIKNYPGETSREFIDFLNDWFKPSPSGEPL